MDRKQQNIFQQMKTDRRKRIGGQASIEESSRPEFLSAAQKEGSRNFKTADIVLSNDLYGLARSDYPTINCIMPYEVDSVQNIGLDTLDRQGADHVRSCSYCSALLSLSQAKDERLQGFLKTARRILEPV